MTLLRFTILLYIPFVCASLLRLNGTSIHTLDANDSPPSNNTRTLWDIIWSCGVTLFACAWTAIHPNIPGMEEKTRYIVFRRICIMAMVLVAPELIITWASRQFFSAIAIKKRFNDALSEQPVDAQDHRPDVEATLRSGSAEFRDWTITHSFFAWMGGFILYVNDEPRATLTPDELLQFVLRESVDMPVIQKVDIEDRSKGDILSKGVAILQLVWFVLQLAARRGQNLPISLLEIDTLAIVVLTCVAYCWWWKKPKDVRRPYIVHWKATALPLGDAALTYDEADSRFSHVGYSRYWFYIIYPWLSSAGMGTITSPSAARSRRAASLGGYGGPSDVTTALKIIGDHVGGLAMKVAMRLVGEDWITSLMRSRVMRAATWLIAEGQRIGCQMMSPLLRAATWLSEVDQRISSSIGSHFMRAATRLFGEERIASLMRSYASVNLNPNFRAGMRLLNRIALVSSVISSGAWVGILIRGYSATLLEGGSEITAFVGGHSGMLLGGIHCLGWNFLFQTHAEQILWRVASFVIACAPLFVLIFLGSRMIDVYLEDMALTVTPPPRSVILWIRHSYAVFGSLLYITARIIIFVLIILSLRSPPPGLYNTVDWTEYLLRFFT